jgi:hypothetical protein
VHTARYNTHTRAPAEKYLSAVGEGQEEYVQASSSANGAADADLHCSRGCDYDKLSKLKNPTPVSKLVNCRRRWSSKARQKSARKRLVVRYEQLALLRDKGHTLTWGLPAVKVDGICKGLPAVLCEFDTEKR